MKRFAAWLSSPRSTWLMNNVESVLWVAFGGLGLFVRPLRESIPVLFFVSCYANAKGARSTAQSARAEMSQGDE